MKKIRALLLITLMLGQLNFGHGANAVVQSPSEIDPGDYEDTELSTDLGLGSGSKLTKAAYVPLEFKSGENPDLEIFLAQIDQVLDFSARKDGSVKFRMNASGLVPKGKYPTSLRVDLYQYDRDGKKVFVSTVRPTIYSKKYAENLEFKADVGRFETDYKDLFMDIYDYSDQVLNTYRFEVRADNLTAQPGPTEPTALDPADCGTDKDFDQCQLEYILRNVTFEAVPKNKIATEVNKMGDGKYLVSIPISKRKSTRFYNSKVNDRGTFIDPLDPNGEDLDSRLFVGIGDQKKSTIEYYPGEDKLGVRFGAESQSNSSSSDDTNDVLTITADKKVGINNPKPEATLDIKVADSTSPAIRLNPAPLSKFALDGGIEYTGENFYFTSNGTRSAIVLLKDQNGKITKDQVSADFVFRDDYQIVTNKTFHNTLITGPFRFPTGAAAGRVFISDKNGLVSWINPSLLDLYDSQNGTEIRAIGKNITSNGFQSMVFGYGNSPTDKLINTINSSLMIGFNSNAATLFVGPSTGGRSTGNIGIGTSNPLAKLHVNGSVLATGYQGNGSGLLHLNGSALDRGMVPASRGGTSRSNTGSMRFANNIWFNGGNITFQTPSSSSVILPTTGTLATLAGIETFTNKTILSPNISNPTINGYALIRNGATLRGPIRIVDGSQTNNFILTSNAGGLAHWENLSTLLNGVNLSIDFLNDAITDRFSNIFVGNGSGISTSVSGLYNTGLGINSLNKNRNGDSNVAIGYKALYNGTSANGNIAIGYQAGNNISTGSRNITIGFDLRAVSPTANDQLNIGNTIFGNLSNNRIAINASTPDASLEVGDGTVNFIDGTDDALIADDLEVDGSIFTTSINGSSAAFTTGSITTLNTTTTNSTTINTTNLNASGTVNGSTFKSALNNGSVVFANASGVLSQNNAQFYWDRNNNRLGLGTNNPSQKLDVNGQLRIRGGAPAKDKVLASLDTAGNGTWMDISTILSNGGAFLDALNDAISDKNYNLFLGNGAGLVSTGRYNTGVGIDVMRTLTSGNGNTMYGFKAGNGMTSGSNNIFIGSDANGSSATASNELNIGNAIFGNLSNGNIGIGIQNPANFKLQVAGDIGPNTDDTYDLGSSSRRFNEAFINYIFAGQINGNVANFNTINSTTANLNSTTINSSYINNTNTITSATFNGVNANISGNVNGGTFDGDFTNGSMLFSNATGVISQNNAQVFWDRNNNRLGLGTNAPSQKLDVNGQVRIRSGNPAKDKVLASLDSAGNGTWMDISTILSNGGAFLDALNDAISDKNYNLFLGNGAGLVSTGRYNTGVGIDAMRTLTTGNGNTMYGFKAGNGMTSGSNNIFIGSDANGSSTTASNELNIGNAIFGNLTNGNIGIGIQNPANFKLQVAGDIGPNTDNTYDLGSSSRRFNEAFIGNIFAGQINGNVANFDTINSTTANLNSTTINSSYINNTNTITSDTFNGVTANISGRTSTGNLISTGNVNGTVANFDIILASTNINGATANFTTGNITTINSTDVNSTTINGDSFDGDFTNGSLLFSNAAGIISENNSMLFWNRNNNRLGLGTNAPTNFILDANGNIGPHRDATYNLGSVSRKWNKLFVQTLNASTLSLGFTDGSIIFSDNTGSLAQNNSQFFWDRVNNKLGIGNSSPNAKLDVTGSIESSAQVNGVTANFTTGNITTIESNTINNAATITSDTFNGVTANISGTVNGSSFDGDFTNGSILFSNADGAIVENNSAFYWSSTNERLGIGTNDPSQSIDTTGQVRIRGGNPAKDKVLASLDAAGNGTWLDISTILTNGGAFLDALNDAISDNNYNLFLGNGAGLVSTGRYNTGLGIDVMRTISTGNGNTALGFKAANGMTSGSNNIFIGSLINGSSATASNELNIGNAIYGNLANGNIGIGVQNPANFKLQVAGDIGPNTDDTNDLGSNARRFNEAFIKNIFATQVNGTTGNYSGTISANKLLVTANINGASLNISSRAGVGSLISTGNVNGTVANFNKILATTVVNGATANFSGTVNGGTFDGDFTNGSLLFSNAAGVISENNAQLYWNRVNNRLGLGTNAPANFLLDSNGDIGPHRDAAYNLGSSTRRWNKLFVQTLNASTLSMGFTNGSIIFSDAAGNLAQNNSQFFWDRSNNRLGIGTNAPAAALQVVGTIRASGQVNGVTANFTTGNITTISSSNISNSVTVTSNSFNGVTANISGNVNGGTFDGDFTNGSMLFSNATGVISQNNSQVFWDRNNNRLGLGTSSPSQKLDVNGQIRIRGGSPQANYVLASLDSAGNGRWMSASTLLSNGGAFLDALNDAISDKNYNLFLGNGTGLVSTGRYNTGLGIDVMRTITTGNGNTALGFKAANGMTSGSNNIFIGSLINGSSATASNELNIGNAIYGNLANGNIGIGVQNPANFKLQVAGDIGPNTDDTNDLGSGSRRFNEAFIKNIFSTQVNGTNANFATGNYSGTINANRLLATTNINGATLNISGRAGVGHLISTGNVNGTVANFNKILAATVVNGATANFTTVNSTNVNSTTVNGSTFDGDFTNGSLLFSNAAGVISENNSQLYWNRANNRLGVGFNRPEALLEVGNGTATYIDGTNDVLVQDDLEVDDTIWATTVNGVDAFFNNGSFNTIRATYITGMMRVNNGSAALPSYTFENDLDTGMYRGNVDNNLGFSVGGSSRMFINATGNVGIGNTNPQAKLDVTGTILGSAQINGVTANFSTGNFSTINSSNINNSVTVTSNSFNGVTANISGIVNGGTFDGDFTNGSMLFSNATGVISQNNAQVFWDRTNNRMGIGTNNPSQKLDVNGQVRIRGGSPQANYILASLDSAGNGRWMSASALLNNGGAFLDALNDAISDKNYNLFLGNGAGLDSTGRNNTGVGIHALNTMRIGNGNTAFGFRALNQLTNGHSNIAIGDQAGIGMLRGNGNIFIGNVNGSSATASNELNIGNAIFGNFTSGNIGIGVQNPTSKLVIAGTTNTFIGEASPTQSGISFGNPITTSNYSLVGDGFNTFINRPTGGYIAFRENNNNQVRFASGGNVGIGDTNPDAKLEIGNGTPNFIDGLNDILVQDDVEVDGTVFATSFNGTSMTLSGSTTIGGSLTLPITSKTADYTITNSDHTVLVSAASANVTITLPTAVGLTGRVYIIKRTDNSANSLTIDGNAAETIDGAATRNISLQYQTLTLQSDGANWFIL